MGYCLSNVPSTVLRVFGVNHHRPSLPDDSFGNVERSGADKVVLILVDGLGYGEWTRQSTFGFFGAMAAKGSARPITSIFPSTTAAALTTVATGLTTQEHGLLEWYLYLREIDSVIMTLPFARPGDSGRDSLAGEVDPSTLFDGRPIFKSLGEAGVGSTSFVNRNIANSAYSRVSHRGSRVATYAGASDLATSLRREVEGTRGPHLFYVYWSYVDSVEHRYGPGTDEVDIESSMISLALQRGFLSKLRTEAARNTLIMVTADHGHIAVSPESAVYLNRNRRLLGSLKRSPRGRMIPPWGSARDVYLSVQDPKLDATQTYLQEKLGQRAHVIKTKDALGAGLFGINKPSRKFLRRVGNLMILPTGANLVWYRYYKGDSLDLRGHHGGLSRDEMTIPFSVGRASELLGR
jgi:predicted AlkP superfamily pyrophosphatase or phosphodiesterase